jgi:hypothetical protein
MRQLVSGRLKALFPDGFWLYVDDSDKSMESIREMDIFKKAGMLTVYDVYRDGGFKKADVSFPFLRRNGDVMVGRELRNFIQHLKELNKEFLREEALEE